MGTRAASGVRLAAFQSGDKHNAIPREGHAALLVPDASRSLVIAALQSEAAGLQEAFGGLEREMQISVDASSDVPEHVCILSDF